MTTFVLVGSCAILVSYIQLRILNLVTRATSKPSELLQSVPAAVIAFTPMGTHSILEQSSSSADFLATLVIGVAAGALLLRKAVNFRVQLVSQTRRLIWVGGYALLIMETAPLAIFLADSLLSLWIKLF